MGPRLQRDRDNFPPNNVILVLAGAGLLWLGWNGFNGGDPYAANIDASMAVLNTNIAAATSLLVWTSLDVIFFGKPSVIGAVQGMITGLVVITPGAGTEFSHLSEPPVLQNWRSSRLRSHVLNIADQSPSPVLPALSISCIPRMRTFNCDISVGISQFCTCFVFR